MAIKAANNRSMTGITALPSAISGGAWTLLSTSTASSSSTVSFTSGLDSTYAVYCFRFYNIHPGTADADFKFNMTIDGGSNWNVAKTTTAFNAYHTEGGTDQALQYHGGSDLAQGTGDQNLAYGIGTTNDDSASGYLYLFDPSSTTFVKHFISSANGVYIDTGDAASPYQHNFFNAGYGNTTSAVDGIIFRMSSGNIDAGVIKLYGIS